MKRLCHVYVTMTITSNGVAVLVSLAEACHFYSQAVENVFADDKLFVHYIQKCVARQQHMYLVHEVKIRYFYNLLIAWTAT